jgi:hypothetical protein
MIWGISSALFEATEIDKREARYINDNLAEYLIPVNADIGAVDVILVPEIDTECNPAGVKGIGELGTVGTAAAIANAVFHATGKRNRELPDDFATVANRAGRLDGVGWSQTMQLMRPTRGLLSSFMDCQISKKRFVFRTNPSRCAFYPVLVHRPAASLHASSPHSVALMQLRFASLAVISSRWDFHP